MEGFYSCGDYCISPDMRCNGVPNCPDGRDERGCPAGTGLGRPVYRGTHDEDDEDGGSDGDFNVGVTPPSGFPGYRPGGGRDGGGGGGGSEVDRDGSSGKGEDKGKQGLPLALLVYFSI